MDATDVDKPTTRELAIEGLRMIAQLEEFVAGQIDEPGFYGRLATVLRDSASDRRQATVRLAGSPSGRQPLRLVT